MAKEAELVAAAAVGDIDIKSVDGKRQGGVKQKGDTHPVAPVEAIEVPISVPVTTDDIASAKAKKKDKGAKAAEK